MHIAQLISAAAASSPSPSPTSGSGSSGGGFNYTLLLFALVIAGMFWFMSRAQRKQRQRMSDLQSRLTPGQQVMTGAGIYGRIIDAEGDKVRVEVAPGVVLTLAKQAIVRTVDETQTGVAGTGTDPAGPREPTVAE